METNTYPEVIFSPELVSKVGSIGKVLGEFLDNQTSKIQSDLLSEFADAYPEAIMHILHAFITLEGTKKPLSIDQINLASVNTEQLNFCLDRLEKARILRYEDGVYELAHDTLALRISDTRSADEVAFLEVIKLVGDRFSLFDTTHTLLNANELHMIRSFEKKLKNEGSLTPEEWQYIDKSARNRRRKRIIAGAAIVILFLTLSAFSIYSFQQTQIARKSQTEAINAQEEAEENLRLLEEATSQQNMAQYNEHLAKGEALMGQSDYVNAIREFEIALAFQEEGETALLLKSQCEELLGVKALFDRYIQAGDNFSAQGNAFLVDARNQYRRALQTGYGDAIAQNKLALLADRLEAAFDKFVDDGDTFFTARGYADAMVNYENALRIKPGDSDLLSKIAQCRQNL